MIHIEPVSPGYIIHLSNKEEWDEIREYVRGNLKRGAILTPTCDGVSLSFDKDGKLVAYGKAEMSWYCHSDRHRDYEFVEFSDLLSEPVDIDCIISGMSSLL